MSLTEGPRMIRLALIVAMVFAAAACSRSSEPTPDIDATVQAAIAKAIPTPDAEPYS